MNVQFLAGAGFGFLLALWLVWVFSLFAKVTIIQVAKTEEDKISQLGWNDMGVLVEKFGIVYLEEHKNLYFMPRWNRLVKKAGYKVEGLGSNSYQFNVATGVVLPNIVSRIRRYEIINI